MALPALVLVHGAQHAGDCWDRTVAEIHRLDAEQVVLAVDLPGRRLKSGDLLNASVGEWVESVVADIEHRGLHDVVIVGHSMAGLIVPGIVTRLGSARVREMILVAAFIPPDGGALVDLMPGVLGWYARRNAQRKVNRRVSATPPTTWATLALCNGMTWEQREFALDRMCPESPTIVLENVDRRSMPHDVPRTWILTRRDRVLTVMSQLKAIAALGGVQTLFPIDAGHDLMISEPAQLAEILVERCRTYG